MGSIIAVIIAYIIWGAGSPVFKYALTDIPPFTLAFIRFFVASLIFLPFALVHIREVKRIYWRHLVIGAVLGISITVGFFFVGLEMAPSINANIIGSVGPLFLYLMSRKVLHEKPHPQIIRGMLVAFFGVLFIIFAPLIKAASFHTLSGADGWQTFLGNGAFFIAMIGNSMFSIENKQIVEKIHSYTITGLQFFIGSLAFIPFMFMELQSWHFSEMTGKGWFGVIYAVFISSALAYVLLNYALSKMHVQETGIFSYVAPIAAVPVAFFLLGEVPDIFFLIGSGFIILGIIVAEVHVRGRG